MTPHTDFRDSHPAASGYTPAGTSRADANMRAERAEIVDAVRQAMASHPDADCLAACEWLLHHVQRVPAMM